MGTITISADGKTRCKWCDAAPEFDVYHDTEWGVPQHNDRVLFEYILLDSFQAGLSWAIILNKRENFRRAFGGFNPEKIARYRAVKIKKLLTDASIVRNRLKIEASVENAKTFLAIQKEFGSFDKYIWSFTNNKQIQKNKKVLDAYLGGIDEKIIT